MTEYLKLLCDESSTTPCYFTDVKTKELLYMNAPMQRLLGVLGEDYCDRKCFEVLQSASQICSFCPSQKNQVVADEFRSFDIYTESKQTCIKSYKTIISYKGREIEFSKFYETDANFIPLQDMTMQTVIERCVEILSIKERGEQMEAFLLLLSEYYRCDRSYLYEMQPRSEGVKKVFFWENENAPKALDDYTKTTHESTFIEWASTGAHLQQLEINLQTDNVINLSQEEVKIYHENNYTTLSVCPSFSENGKLFSILGLLNKRRKTESSDQSVLRIVAIFIDMTHKGHCPVMPDGETQFVDNLTGVWNRSKYHKVLQRLKFENPKDVGVVFINVNGLKKTNQHYGLDAGDKLIQESMDVAKKAFDYPWYRLSGDEFICFVTDVPEQVFKDALSALHDTLATMQQRLFALGSAWGQRSNDMDKLVDTADTMMFIDKQTFYTDFDPNKMEFSDHVLEDLLQAIQDEEFLVYLQPKIDLSDDKVVGAEALIRRFHKKQNKMIFPDQFIPLYEKKSIIRHVDLFVLRKICILLQEWNKLGKKLKVSVNLSRVTLLEHGVVHKFAKICDDYDIPHQQIVVEVTERVGLIENEVESPLIEQFKHYGFTISLDDFGCAYSNIVTLAMISVDEVKIDKSLVDNILTNHKNRTIVENMIRMVDGFGDTTTLAEGVETREQAECLKACNCKYVQGYLYSRPIPSEEFFDKYVKDNT